MYITIIKRYDFEMVSYFAYVYSVKDLKSSVNSRQQINIVVAELDIHFIHIQVHILGQLV